MNTGIVPSSGMSLARILPPMSRFTPDGKRNEIKSRVARRIEQFVSRFRSIIG
jgi:type I restriction enzyme R subunit